MTSIGSGVRRLVPVFVAVAFGLCLASPAAAYVIILKDGTRLTAREKPSVQGDKLIFYTKIGTAQSVALADYDEAKTVAVNKAGTGDAYEITNPGSGKAINFGKKSALSDFVKTHKGNVSAFATPVPGVQRAPGTASPSMASKDKPASTAALEKALNDAPATQGLDAQINDAFLRALETSGIRGPHLLPISRGVRVDAVVESEQQVFAAIGAVARAMKEIRARNKPVDKVELRLATAKGDPAGTFVMSPDDADSLLNGKIAVAKYFVANVMF